MESKQKYLLFIILSIGILIRFLNSFTKDRSDSKFKVNEADLPKKQKSASEEEKKKGPLKLDGFSFDGKPHEILRIHSDASEKEINKAYKELMKRFHPDMIGKQNSREWVDAQTIAEKINAARAAMLVRHSQKK